MEKYFFIILLSATLVLLPQVHAAKLFGVDLLTATKTTLRQAAKQGGARLKQEADESRFYDEYFSAGLLKGSDKLYFGYSKKTEKFAFAEYEFKGLNNEKMLLKLINKYGQPKKLKQVFISDTVYRWEVAGIEISFYRDWHQSVTRVTYVVPETLAEIKTSTKDLEFAITRGELSKQTNAF